MSPFAARDEVDRAVRRCLAAHAPKYAEWDLIGFKSDGPNHLIVTVGRRARRGAPLVRHEVRIEAASCLTARSSAVRAA